MFLERFSPLIKRNPQISDALRRVADHFLKLEKRNNNSARIFEVEFTPTRLFDISQAGSSARFAKIITTLIDAKIIKKRYIIRSPLGPEIFETPSWYDCPLEVYDPLRDINMEVGDSDLETVYSVIKDESH